MTEARAPEGGPRGSRVALDPRERFLRAIADRVGPDRIREIRLFSPIRQGGKESGVAVIAALPEEAGLAGSATSRLGAASESPTGEPSTGEPPTAECPTPEHPIAEQPTGERRLTICRAQYRLTLKGPERGKWEVDVTVEADAPLATLDDVVRGVQRRAGDDGDPERLTADGLRAALSDAPWNATPL